MEHNSKANILTLPIMAVGRIDIGRLLREVDAVHEFMEQSALRLAGTQPNLPKNSRLFEELVAQNKLNMLVADDRDRLRAFLESVRAKAPVLHVSFSADPSPRFLQSFMTYLRSEIHPLVLLQVGLQPNIGAGCVVRTNNKYFDFSLRERFKARHEVLINTLRGVAAADQEVKGDQ